MPINPNIALGAQPQQPVNFLGQMGQMLALKGAAQEIQGGEALRDFYASGGNATTPEGARALMAANPKMGMQILKGQSEMSARDVETQAKSLKSIKDNVSLVNSPEGMVEFLRGAYSTPGGALLAKLAPLDKAIAAIPSDPRAFADYKRNLGLTSEKLFESADAQLSSRTSLATTGMTTAATRRGQDMTDARMREQQAFEQQKRNVIAGEGQFLQTDAYGNVYPVAQFGATRGPNAPAQPLPQAAANAFVTQQPPVNALAPTAPAQPSVNALVQPGSPTVANALAMEQQQNIPRPKVPYTAPVAVMKDGKPVLVQGREAIGMTPATAFTERQAAGKIETVRSLNTAISNLTDAIKPGGLLEKSTGSGFGRMVDASAAFVGKATEGAKAAASLAPIADLVLKMVPRFEGPQSDRDTQSYKEAAGQLADSGLPNETRKDAAKVILRLMKERKDQFGMSDQVGGSGAGGGAPADPLGIR